MGDELSYRETWKGEYRGVTFEVVHWRLGWNYYLLIPVEQLPKEIQPKFNLRSRTYKLSDDGRKDIAFDYSGALIISDLDWHGGITLYKKQRDERGKVMGYKLGCDYMHLWDENRTYYLEGVAVDAKRSIDALWKLIPNLLMRCAWNGKYYPEEKTYLTKNGVRYAYENKEKVEAPI